MNVLLVGSDSRDRLEGQDALQAGKGAVSGQRSDTIMVLHIDPAQEQAAILSIPRDLYVPIAGEGYCRPGQRRLRPRRRPGPDRDDPAVARDHHQPLRRGRLRRVQGHRRRGGRGRALPAGVGAGLHQRARHPRDRLRRGRRHPGPGVGPQPELPVPARRRADLGRRPPGRPGSHRAPAGLHPADAQEGPFLGHHQPHPAQPAHRYRSPRRHPRRRPSPPRTSPPWPGGSTTSTPTACPC